MHSQKYQHYCNGPYALVDSYYNGIWLTLSNEAMAHDMRRVFKSKIPFLVFDLQSFENFDSNQNTVDSTVCLDWQIPQTNQNYFISPNLHSTIFEQTFLQGEYTQGLQLINQPANSPLSDSVVRDLQDQLFFYKIIAERFDPHKPQLIKSKYKKSQSDFFDKIKEIFKIELTIQDIEQQIQKTAKDHFLTNGPYSVFLLNLIGSNLYE